MMKSVALSPNVQVLPREGRPLQGKPALEAGKTETPRHRDSAYPTIQGSCIVFVLMSSYAIGTDLTSLTETQSSPLCTRCIKGADIPCLSHD